MIYIRRFSRQLLFKSFSLRCGRTLELLAHIIVLTEKSPFELNFHATLPPMFVIGIGTPFILLIISFGKILTRELIFLFFNVQ